MRKTLIILPMLMLASPAFAQDVPSAVQLPGVLSDPAAQMRLAARLQSISSALLNIRVGEVAAALEGRDASLAERNVTIGDMVRRKDPNFDRELAREVATVGPKVQRGMQPLNH